MTNNRNDNVNTRNLVVDILLAVTRDGAFSHIAIRDVLDKYRYLPKQDRAFITRLSQGTIERMIELDAIINQFSKTKVKKMKPVIAAILRSGVYQLKYMDSVPDSAACNEAVKADGKTRVWRPEGICQRRDAERLRGTSGPDSLLPDAE